jgi:hypothetical protein
MSQPLTQHSADSHDRIRVQGARENNLKVFEGAPADLVAARSTLIGEHPTAFVGSRPKAFPAVVPDALRARPQRRSQ